MEPILTIKGLSKRFVNEKRYAVNNISFSLQKGEILALIGESGCGKTTILRLIAGFETPNEGSIYINNKIIVDDKTFIKPEKRKLGMVFQDYALFPHLTVEKNILYGVGKNSNKEKILNDVLVLTGLKGYEKKFPHQLSGGQQQRVALARALAPQPNLILLDEPFSNLDESLKNQVREEVTRIIKKSGATAIFVTHDTRDALATADKIVVLKEGEIKQLGNPKAIFNQPTNKYVAEYFGKINFLKRDAINKVADPEIGESVNSDKLKNNSNNEFGLRSLYFSLIPQPSSIKINGIIKSNNYFGNYSEVHLEVNNETIIADLPNETKYPIGGELTIYYKTENIIFLNKN